MSTSQGDTSSRIRVLCHCNNQTHRTKYKQNHLCEHTQHNSNLDSSKWRTTEFPDCQTEQRIKQERRESAVQHGEDNLVSVLAVLVSCRRLDNGRSFCTSGETIDSVSWASFASSITPFSLLNCRRFSLCNLDSLARNILVDTNSRFIVIADKWMTYRPKKPFYFF